MRIRATIEQGELSSAAELVKLTTREGLSKVFDLEAQFVWSTADLDLDKMIWSSARVALEDLETGAITQLSGVIEEAEWEPVREDRSLYRLRLRPRLNGLSYRVRSRIFQDQDVKQIAQQIFKDAGIPGDSVDWKLSRQYPKRELCVQYQESELAFVQRLFEDEGIFFFFRHEDAGEVMVIGDDPKVLEPQGEVPVYPFLDQEHGHGAFDVVYSSRLVHDAFAARDWNWKQPASPLDVTEKQDGSLGLERYEYPGRFVELGDGTRNYEDRLEAATVDRHTLEGDCNIVTLAPGGHFTVEGSFPGGDFMATHVERRFDSYQPKGEGGSGAGTGSSPSTSVEASASANAADPAAAEPAGPAGTYRAHFRAIPSTTPYRPPRITPKPRIAGKECAVVTGPSGEEIHVDEFGRVKVHFYWDREGKIDDHASCWIRVQQIHTSGSMLLPRVGWEVSVGFIDGDPDRPVVMQKLYNQETMPPYALPDNHSQMSLQSSSSPGGGGTNEIRMQDGSGGMELFMHASKDLSTSVGNDLTEDVTADSASEIGVAWDMLVGVDQTLKVGADHKISVTKTWSESTVGDKTVDVAAMDDWGTSKNHTVAVDGSWKEKVGGVMNVLANEVAEKFNDTCERTIGAAYSLNAVTDIVDAVAGKKSELIGGVKLELISKAKEETIKNAKALTAGLLIVKAGKEVAVGAKATLAHTVGGPWVEKCGEGFTVTGNTVKVLAAGGVSFKVGGTELDAKGTSLKVKASSLGAGGKTELKLKGKINYKK